MSDERKALEILWSIGLSPSHHPDLVTAAEGVRDIVRHLWRDHADPPADLQESVLRKLGVQGFTDGAPAERRLVEMQPARQWCAWCGAMTDHGSGSCPDLKERTGES